MAKQGYIKLSRGYFDDPLWNEARVYSKAEAWLDLIQQARFEASTELIAGKVIEIQRGEMPASRRYLEVRWKWGSSKVTTYMKMLTQMGRINQRQTNGQTVYRLLNYGVYNDAKPQANQDQTTPEPPPNQNKGSKGKKVTKYNPLDYLESLGVEKFKAQGWIAYRKFKKASVSKTVIDNIDKVAQQVSMSLTEALVLQETRNWQGFQLDWINKKNINENTTTHTSRGKKDGVHASLSAEVDALQ